MSNVDPSGQRAAGASGSQVKQQAKLAAHYRRMQTRKGTPKKAKVDPLTHAKDIAGQTGQILGIAAAIFILMGVALEGASKWAFGLAEELGLEALANFAFPVIAAAFLAAAAAAATLGELFHVAARQAGVILAGEAAILAGLFGYQANNDDMTQQSLSDFANLVAGVVATFAVAWIISSMWGILMAVPAFASLAGGILSGFILQGSLLAWCLGRINMMKQALAG